MALQSGDFIGVRNGEKTRGTLIVVPAPAEMDPPDAALDFIREWTGEKIRGTPIAVPVPAEIE
jgi:hypothetical protein